MEPTASEVKIRDDVYNKAVTYGIAKSTARNLAYKLLLGWTADDLSSVFAKLQKFPGDASKMRLVHRAPRSWTLGFTQWVKPPLELVKKAAAEKRALCVNRDGQFAIRESGFAALSHVWTEGLYADGENRGLPKAVHNELFEKLKLVEEAKWLWMDSLAVPGGDKDLDVAAEKIKVDLINNMSGIYGKADTVIILDALVLNLNSSDPIDIAVALLCGRWRSRMWTYQESRLARSAKILTAAGPIEIRRLINQLMALDKKQALSSAKSSSANARNLKEIIAELDAMFNLKNKSGMIDIGRTCTVRETGYDIDYARALFPALGMTWSDKYDREQGMSAIYNAYQKDVARLAFTFGSSRLTTGPGWAPSYLNNLDMEPAGDVKWTPRGLQGNWHLYKIRSVARHNENTRSLYLEFDQGALESTKCWAFTSNREVERARLGFIDAVNTDKGVLLTSTLLLPIRYKKFGGQSRIVCLARQSEVSMEVQVYLTAEIYWMDKPLTSTPGTYTLSHENPLKPQTQGEDDDDDVMKEAFTTKIDNDIPYGSKMHEYVRLGQAQQLENLLRTGAYPNPLDEIGWTPINWAVVQSPQVGTDLIHILLTYFAKTTSAPKGSKTPLILAMEFASDEVVWILTEQGADQREVRGVTPLTQALFSKRSTKLIEFLITHGADVNRMDVFGKIPLSYASDHKYLRCLLQEGADPSKRLRTGRSLLHLAAIEDSPARIQALVKYGAAVDMLEKGLDNTPLYYAVTERNEKSVATLLELYANPNRPCTDGKTPLMHAIISGNFNIVERLLQAGARVDGISRAERWTPLHVAVRNSQSRILNLLLEQRDSEVAIWRKDSQGLTAYKLAGQLGFHSDESMSVILERRMDANRADNVYKTGGILIFVLLGIAEIFQVVQYICDMLGYGHEQASIYLSRNENRVQKKVLWNTWILARLRSLFSTDYFLTKFIILAGICWFLDRTFDPTARKNVTEFERIMRSWRNRGQTPAGQFSYYFGGLLPILLILRLTSLLAEYFGRTIGTLVFVAISTLVVGYITYISNSGDRKLGAVIVLPTLWIVSAGFLGWVEWRVVCTYLATVTIMVFPAAVGGKLLLGVLEITKETGKPKRTKILFSEYNICLWGSGVTLWCVFMFATYRFGWLFGIVLFLDLVPATWISMLYPIYLDALMKNKNWNLYTQFKLSLWNWVYCTAFLGALWLVDYCIGRIAFIITISYSFATLVINFASSKAALSKKLAKFATFTLTWVVLAGIELLYGWLKGGAVSLALVLGPVGSILWERRRSQKNKT